MNWRILDILSRRKNSKTQAQKTLVTTFVDASDWQEARQYQTGGTREKCWLINPTDFSYHFFKVSIKKEKIDYKTEFWMEIIASKVGQSLGLNVLDYNIAKHRDLIGCISQDMVPDKQYSLVELMQFLMGYNPQYNPEDDHEKYTIDFVNNALKFYGLDKFLPEFIDVLVFDCIIGNQDRHQENWGFIAPADTKQKLKEHVEGPQDFWRESTVAPIYDSGSSLGREKSEDAIRQALKDSQQIDAYVKRYSPEVRWKEGPKTKYEEFIRNMIASPRYGKWTKDSIKRLVSAYDVERVHELIAHVDDSLPEECAAHRLTGERKQYVMALMDRRINQLKQFI